MDKEKWVEWFAQYVNEPFCFGEKFFMIVRSSEPDVRLSLMGLGMYHVQDLRGKYVCSLKCDFRDFHKVEWLGFFFEQTIYGHLALTDVAQGIEQYKAKNS